MFKNNDKLTLALIALPFILVMFIVAAVLINSDRVPKNNLSVNNPSGTENIWLSSSVKNIKKGQDFDFDVYLNTQGEELGVIAIDLLLDKNRFIVNTQNGKNGVSKGIDSKNLSVMANTQNINEGHYLFSGICVKNCAKGDGSHIATIHLKALADFKLPKKANWIKVNELANTLGNSFNLNDYNGQLMIK